MKNKLLSKLQYKILDSKIKKTCDSLSKERELAYNLYLKIDSYGIYYFLKPERMIARLNKFSKLHEQNIDKYSKLLSSIHLIENEQVKNAYIEKLNSKYESYNKSSRKYIQKVFNNLTDHLKFEEFPTPAKIDFLKYLEILKRLYFINVGNDKDLFYFLEDREETVEK